MLVEIEDTSTSNKLRKSSLSLFVEADEDRGKISFSRSSRIVIDLSVMMALLQFLHVDVLSSSPGNMLLNNLLPRGSVTQIPNCAGC